ncbi:MAG TPA: DUF3142 domain-containing protein [Blastocatellia bacterium]|nr:DUF3142 domain-containing protein [Blastocatellia bacterium]
MFSDSFPIRLRGREKAVARFRVVSAVGLLCVLSINAFLWEKHSHHPRVWRPGELPVAFWAWQSRAPKQTDVDAAIRQAGGSELFLRAGQIDVEGGRPLRIRPVAGAMPKNIKLYLVYNATRDFLAGFANLKPVEVAEAVAGAYASDARRAVVDGTTLEGAQLDFDVPTRLLTAYARLLVLVRERLPAEATLSITGLPAWMASQSLNDALSRVDFWIPQCYGASIPKRVAKREPIASPKLVAEAVARARQLGRPFYAGLAAYGYAIHYSRDGSLLALRGDLNPEAVASTPALQLVRQDTFGDEGAVRSQQAAPSDLRQVYRAQGDCVIEGTAVRAEEWIVLEVPTSASFRECAFAAREQGGELLLGLCVFRLPSADDPTTLSTNEVSCALADLDPGFSFNLQALELPQTSHVQITVENDGSVSSAVGQSAMMLMTKVPSGTVRAVRLAGFQSYEAVVDAANDAHQGVSSLRRANTLNFKKSWWRPGARASVEIEFVGEPPVSIWAECRVVSDDGREFSETRTAQINRGGEQ